MSVSDPRLRFKKRSAALPLTSQLAPGEWPAAGGASGAHVLVADDDPILRAALERLLRREGYEVTTAADGNGVLAAFGQRPPDLLVMDVMMPEPNGFEVCQRLKSQPETRLIPVVLVTGLNAMGDRIRGIEAGADDFLSKPVGRIELLARVRSLLRVKSYVDELERAESVVFALAKAIEERDAYTEGHCERLAAYASCLGQRLGLPEDEITALRRAGIVHDIGKIAVPDGVLLKQGPLTPDEWALMREHPVTGERICRGLKSFRLVLPIIRHHHEKLDGTGYPDGLRGAAIPATARVLQVVDVYDALATDRPYRRALLPSEAIEVLYGEAAKGWWDRQVVAAFARMLAEDGGGP